MRVRRTTHSRSEPLSNTNIANRTVAWERSYMATLRRKGKIICGSEKYEYEDFDIAQTEQL